MSIARHHAEWLSLVEQSGPFLSLPVLMRQSPPVFPQGLDEHDPEHFQLLRTAYDEWQNDQRGLLTNWVEFVLKETLGYGSEVLRSGQSVPPGLVVRVAEQGEQLAPEYVAVNAQGAPDAGKPRILISVYPLGQNLDGPVPGKHWKASPSARMMEMLHATGVLLGLITNGEQWMLVHAPQGETTSYASWYGHLWLEEKITLRAFRSLLGRHRLFGVAPTETLEALFKESATNQQEVTDQLGLQVRRAVEVLVQSLDRIDQDHKGQLLRDIDEKRLYESALTVMMRLVFLFCAEERELLPIKDEFYAENYAVSTLRDELRTAADKHGEQILECRHDAWSRLLATFRLIHGGVSHDRLHLPAYGGGLFDPDRFAFLEGRLPGSRWRGTPAQPVKIDNRTVLHLLEALQILQVKVPGGGAAEARRVSFRALDIEQIGHVYEGLLDHTAIRSSGPVLGLYGAKGKEPEIELAELEKLANGDPDKLIAFLVEETGRSESALRSGRTGKSKQKRKAVAAGQDMFSPEERDETNGNGLNWVPESFEDEGTLRAACGNDQRSYSRVRPFARLIRPDSFGHPVVIPAGSVYVTQGSDRRSTGTHYTPRSFTEPIVQHTLEPLVYQGPAEGLPKEQWKLRTARELLDLKICDMAMGSGAFLVQACRYMSERLVEAWENEAVANGGRPITVPFADPATGQIEERPLPPDLDERLALARRFVAERCLYGVDVNPLAVDIAKLSLWLVTLQKNIPFTFLDHALKCGDSLLGVHDPRQIECFHLDSKQGELLNHDFVNRLSGDVVGSVMHKATELRQRLESFVVSEPRDVDRKTKLLHEANHEIEKLRLLANLVIGGALRAARKEAAYDDLIQRWMQEDVFLALDPMFSSAERQTHLTQLGSYASESFGRSGRIPFHWPVEFPEVFEGRSRGFHAIIGNPPFMHGSWISTNYGEDYSGLLRVIHPHISGKVDLAVSFLSRSVQLGEANGTCGLILTDRVREGDARRSGFEYQLAHGMSIIRACKNVKWPNVASVVVCSVHMARNTWKGIFVLDGRVVSTIDSRLEAGTSLDDAYSLAQNAGKAYLGAKPDSLGFMMDASAAMALIDSHPSYGKVLKPYYSGVNITDYPVVTTDRWVIDFSETPLEDAARMYPDLLDIVRQKVKPSRMKLKRASYRERWWQFTEPQLALFQQVRVHSETLAVPRVSKYFSIAQVPTAAVYSDKVVLFVRKDFFDFAVLSSEFHNQWSLYYGATHGVGCTPNYKPTECAATFPFPDVNVRLRGLGQRLHEFRQEFMLSVGDGLTSTYNRFHSRTETSAEITELRRLHAEIDQAVATAYGWTDLNLGHGFHETKHGMRYTVGESARRKILDRLLQLNHERYRQECEQGLHDERKSGKATVRKLHSRKSVPADEDLFTGLTNDNNSTRNDGPAKEHVK